MAGLLAGWLAGLLAGWLTGMLAGDIFRMCLVMAGIPDDGHWQGMECSLLAKYGVGNGQHGLEEGDYLGYYPVVPQHS